MCNIRPWLCNPTIAWIPCISYTALFTPVLCVYMYVWERERESKREGGGGVVRVGGRQNANHTRLDRTSHTCNSSSCNRGLIGCSRPQNHNLEGGIYATNDTRIPIYIKQWTDEQTCSLLPRTGDKCVFWLRSGVRCPLPVTILRPCHLSRVQTHEGGRTDGHRQ